MSFEAPEKFGPRVGVKLDPNGADLIMTRHLGKSCSLIKEVKRGYNNRIYIGTASDESLYVIRLSGIHWTKLKTESEVAAIMYLRMKCPDLPLPNVYGYCSSRELSGIGQEYIIMEQLHGSPLDDVFSAMTFDEQKEVLAQLAKIAAQIHSIKFDTIGSFHFTSRIGDTFGLEQDVFKSISLDDIVVGLVLDQGVGPFKNWLSFYNGLSKVEIQQLRKCKYMEPQMANLARMESFLEVITDPAQTPLSAHVSQPSIVFTHGDFEPRNILVSGTKVTGIHDLEFSGAFPLDNEWFDGFSDFGANSLEILSGETENEETLTVIRDYFLSEYKKCGAPLPSEKSGHFERAALYQFMCSICPWYRRENRMEVDIPESWAKDRMRALECVERILSNYGF